MRQYLPKGTDVSGYSQAQLDAIADEIIDALEAGVHDYVHYYNHERIKLGLQGLSPVEYRLRSTA